MAPWFDRDLGGLEISLAKAELLCKHFVRYYVAKQLGKPTNCQLPEVAKISERAQRFETSQTLSPTTKRRRTAPLPSRDPPAVFVQHVQEWLADGPRVLWRMRLAMGLAHASRTFKHLTEVVAWPEGLQWVDSFNAATTHIENGTDPF